MRIELEKDEAVHIKLKTGNDVYVAGLWIQSTEKTTLRLNAVDDLMVNDVELKIEVKRI